MSLDKISRDVETRLIFYKGRKLILCSSNIISAYVDIIGALQTFMLSIIKMVLIHGTHVTLIKSIHRSIGIKNN
ncbi:hypothetical protein BpHYR1_044817 [Brachionus plicatilis]|uniref:Uncharacterized protein n=1 Tax=Brachionus plicatilis TaxID=10195 RepID=A0A3M7QH89_BRAPC|nr:hypothetical protein BpHYR1_044817 [Brachionus plicatilis]